MGYQPIEELLPKCDWSIYKLVRMASNRALELSEGKPPLVKGFPADKLATIALEEIAQGLVVSKESSARIAEEAKMAEEQAGADEEQ